MNHHLKKIVPPGLKNFIKKTILSRKGFYNKGTFSYLKYSPRYSDMTLTFLGREIKIVDSASFLFIYKEIFEKEIFKFNTNETAPFIIDGGANIGLATIYFKQLYPHARIVAFEPDPKIFKVLQQNIASFQLKDITLVNKALSDKESFVNFYSEGADGGRINLAGDGENIIHVPTMSLREYLDKGTVDFLKLDIEGAEIDVMQDIKGHLSDVKRLFVEYHSFIDAPQRLNEIFDILTLNDFRIYVNAPGLSPENPFLDIPVNQDMDMQLNVYAIKK